MLVEEVKPKRENDDKVCFKVISTKEITALSLSYLEKCKWQGIETLQKGWVQQ